MIPVVKAEKRTYEALIATGHTTVATVVEQGETTDHDDKRSHWVRLTYVDFAGREHTEDLSVSEKIHQSLPIGSTVPVRYLRDHPETVKLETTLPEPEWKETRALTLTFGVIGMLIVGLSLVRAARRVSEPVRRVPSPDRRLVSSDRAG
jgi:hypothetical protein